jgi:hypothetical protein
LSKADNNNTNFVGPHQTAVAVLVKLAVRVAAALYWTVLGVQIGTERSRRRTFLLMPSNKYGRHCTDFLEIQCLSDVVT